MSDYFSDLDEAVMKISIQYEIKNLYNIQNRYDENDYWPRLSKGKYFEKLYKKHKYHFLYEIQGLSSQIHFGLVSCFLFREKISIEPGNPNVYNHRYTFMIESTIHGIYSFWNRVGLVLNTYLTKPFSIKKTYFPNVINQLVLDYPELQQDSLYEWINTIRIALNNLDRNEFTHNNSLIMQNFLPSNPDFANFKGLLAMPELLLLHNKYIVDEIYNLVQLVEKLDTLS